MIKTKIKLYLLRIYVILYGKFHKIEKKVLFDSFNGKQYSDSPRAISEKLHDLYPEYQIVWKIDSKQHKYNLLPQYVKVVNNKEFYKQLATCMCYVTNEGMTINKYKRKNQFFIQTWHGDRPLKKILYDAIEEKEEKNFICITDNKVTDLCVAASDMGEYLYRYAFKYNGKILKVGMPRNDKLIKKDKKEYEKIKETLGIPFNTNILLVAPTYRDQLNTKQSVCFDIESILKILEQQGEKWVCIVRAHTVSKGLQTIESSKIIDATDYPDMADLLLVSDMLITDYSSCAGDFVLLDKAVILAVFNRNDYKNQNRELYIEPEEAGFLTANNQKELEDIISNNSAQSYKDNCKKIQKYYNIIETGKASEEICNKIKEFELTHNIKFA